MCNKICYVNTEEIHCRQRWQASRQRRGELDTFFMKQHGKAGKTTRSVGAEHW